MIIPNPVVRLDYDPGRDILSVRWPDVHAYSVSEAAHTFGVIVETLKHYDVKHLLTDTRMGIVEITEAQYKELILGFVKGLATTRVRKVARVVIESTLRERVTHEVRQEVSLLAQIRSFYTVEEALEWLTSG